MSEHPPELNEFDSATVGSIVRIGCTRQSLIDLQSGPGQLDFDLNSHGKSYKFEVVFDPTDQTYGVRITFLFEGRKIAKIMSYTREELRV